MGINAQVLPDSILRCIDRRDRPRGNAGLTAQEAEAKRQLQCELELHTQFSAFLRRHNFEDVEYSNPHRSTRARKGRPDFLVTRNNRRLGIEFKIGKNKLSPEQEQFFAMATRQGNTVLCCYDYESASKATIEFFGL